MEPSEHVAGRVISLRNFGGVMFLSLVTGAGKRDLVCDREVLGPEGFSMVRRLRRGYFCRVAVVARGKDVCVKRVLCCHSASGDQGWGDRTGFLLQAYSFLLCKIREHLGRAGYVEVRLPCVHFGHMKKDCFPLEFFGKPARLSSSNALFSNAFAMQLVRVYSIQRCFRAEKSRTRKHLAEFDMLEVTTLCSVLEEEMQRVEDLVLALIDIIGESEFAALLLPEVTASAKLPFRRLSYASVEADYNLAGKGLGCHDVVIAGKAPVFVTHFPEAIGSWTAESLGHGCSASFNLLLPNAGEVAEGAQRHNDKIALMAKFRALGLEDQLGWYAQSISYAECRSTGFGLGVERLAMWLFGVRNIRALQPIFRDTRFSEVRPCEA